MLNLEHNSSFLPSLKLLYLSTVQVYNVAEKNKLGIAPLNWKQVEKRHDSR